MQDFAASDPRAYFVPTNDFTVFGDNLIHFSASDQMALGQRIASLVQTQIIPEPASAGLVGVAGVVLLRRRR